jgi:hypothetical protein
MALLPPKKMLNFFWRANDDTRRRTPTEFSELKNDKNQHVLGIA